MPQNSYFINIGDIIFQSLKDEAPFSQAVTCSGILPEQVVEYVNHVALYIGDGKVVEATHDYGVRKQSLTKFLSLAKINLAATISDLSLVDTAINNAKNCLGMPYNNSFHPNDDGFYCSELIVYAFKTHHGDNYFQQYPMNFTDMSSKQILPYWVSYYAQLGKEIPEGVIGSHPQQLLRQKDKFKSIKQIIF